jgi:hypothetical protein
VFKGTQKKNGGSIIKKGDKKKGMPKWKNAVAEIENLTKRIPKESPPTGILYYKF